MFKVGDKVIYTVHGAGTIVDIQEIEILGNTESYYILQLPINDIKVSVPVKEAEEQGMRPIISKEEGMRVWDILRSDKTAMSKNWGKRYRDNLELLKTGDIFEIADIVRNLALLDMSKGLSASEKKMLNDAKRVMASELILSGTLSKEEAIKLIDEAIANENSEETE